MEPECQHLDDGEFLGRTFIFCWEGVLLGALTKESLRLQEYRFDLFRKIREEDILQLP
jgi:hypothetical protein